MYKRIIILLVISALILSSAYSQQLTRVAVVDLSRVYQEFFRESQAVRDFEARSARVQNDIDRMQREIQELRTRHANAIQNNNQTEINRLETDINRRTENLRNFHQARMAELERERSNLVQSGSFLNEVHDEVRLLCEREGFTLVVNINNNPGIVYYNPSFDITNRLIASLRARRDRN